MLISAALVLVGLTSVVLFIYGLNMLYLSWRSVRIKPHQPALVEAGEEPRVAVQIPIYNERYVAERIIDAAARLDWPRQQLEIQVLDDSDDETVAIVAARVAYWKRRAVRIEHIRRAERLGYKAGALGHGLELTDAPLIAIFDADFVPGRDFLRRVASPLRRSIGRLRPGPLGPPQRALLLDHAAPGAVHRLPLPGRAGGPLGVGLPDQLHRHRRGLAPRGDRRRRRLERSHADRGSRP